MSEGLLQSFNINELAGATGLILGGVSGLLVVIFKSRCYCKFRVGCNDNCSLCMCERKPPPDNNNIESEEEDKQIKPNIKKTKSQPPVAVGAADDEDLIPPNKPINELV
jgi:hypothetical protein